MTSRFEGYPLDERWRADTRGTALTTVDLGPLGREESEQLASSFTPTPDAVTARCIERAEGNPLFLRQLLHDAAEARTTAIPATIQSVVLARMDRLDARDKRALQAASILGKHFDLDALRHLLLDAEYECTPLIEADLARRQDGGLVFAHALVHEGVYASLLHARKRELHKRAADWYGGEEPILRAEHLDRAGDGAAAAAYLAAALVQARAFQHESALDLVDRGLRVVRDEATRCSLLLQRGELLRDAGRSDESLVAFQSALALCTDDAQRYLAWMGAVAAYRVRTDLPAALNALGEAQAIVERLGAPVERSRVHHLRGNLLFAAGDGPACSAEHEAALLHAQEAGDVECQAQALGGLGDAEYLQGRMRNALRCFEHCQRSGFPTG
jgi:tetratricopeptide (TPR) repeat protein